MSGAAVWPMLGGEIEADRVQLRVQRAVVQLDIDVNRREVSRRHALGVESILDLDLLRLLLSLDFEVPSEVDTASRHTRSLVALGDRLYALQFVDSHQSTVIRLANPPVVVKHVTVTNTSWRNGLKAASRFAPYASRSLLLDRLPDDDLELRLEAHYLGIGVDLRDGSDSVRSIVTAAPFVPHRFSAASWLFSESVARVCFLPPTAA